jgi:hypothetical protein
MKSPFTILNFPQFPGWGTSDKAVCLKHLDIIISNILYFAEVADLAGRVNLFLKS